MRSQKEYLKQELRRLVEQGQLLGMSLEDMQQAMADLYEPEES